MSKAEQLNVTLARSAPAALACLSPLGRELAFPDGIPAQSAEAADCELNATIGQLTDGRGRALAPPALSSLVSDRVPDQAFLYGSTGGLPALRRQWRDRLLAESPGAQASLPVVTVGITHAVSVTADLFADPDTDVLVPSPYWGNYRMIFSTRRGARLRTYNLLDGDRGLAIDELRKALAATRRKAVLVLNLPSNPAGYSPRLDEVPALLQVVLEHPRPLVVLLDDAYHGWVYEQDVLRESLFGVLSQRADPRRLLVVKADGATKELLYFGGRVGFLTFGADADAAAALEDKALAAVRGTVSLASTTAQALALTALRDPDLDAQIAERLELVARRYRRLKAELAELHGSTLRPFPFNSGFFAMVGIDPRLDVEIMRRRLILEQSVGLTTVPAVNALRIAFCSIREDDISELIRRMQRVLG